MKLISLSLTNFMPYKGESRIEFPTDDARNVMIIFGDNMRGKTSLLNALRWAFYGRAVGRHSRHIPLQDLVNREAASLDDWTVEVCVRFEANGHAYDLRRRATRKQHVATPSRPDDFHVTVYLSRDGAAVSGDQVEPEIDQFAPEQTSRFFLFDGELLEEYESLLIEGSEQGRQIKVAIEQVLGVPALIHGRTELGAIVKSATKKQSQEIAHIQGLEQQAERQQALTAQQEAYERDYKSLADRLTEKRAERTRLDDELELAASLLASKARLDALSAQAKGLVEMRDLKRGERQEILSRAWQDVLDAKLEAKRAQLVQRQQELAQVLKKQGRIQSQVESLEKLLATSSCPTCGQNLGVERRAEVGETLGRLQVESGQIESDSGELQSVSAQLAGLNKIRGVGARERLLRIDKEMRKAEVDLQRIENESERLRDEIAGQDTAELARKRVLQQESLKEEGRLQSQLAVVERDLKRTKEELAVVQKAISGLAPGRSQRSTLKVAIAADLERVFTASIERLRDQLRSRVEAFATDAFRQMTTQKSYRRLEINSNYGLSIIGDDSRKVPVRSAGAEQVVALSLIDGLNRTSRAAGPIVMDTPFGRLDRDHRDNILNYLPTVTSQFVLLVHSGEVRPETDLATIKPRIGAAYRIMEISATHSAVEKVSL